MDMKILKELKEKNEIEILKDRIKELLVNRAYLEEKTENQ
jgi:hypothetical protein